MRVKVGNRLGVVFGFVITNLFFGLLEAINFLRFDNDISRTLIIIFVNILAVEFVIQKDEDVGGEDVEWQIED